MTSIFILKQNSDVIYEKYDTSDRETTSGNIFSEVSQIINGIQTVTTRSTTISPELIHIITWKNLKPSVNSAEVSFVSCTRINVYISKRDFNLRLQHFNSSYHFHSHKIDIMPYSITIKQTGHQLRVKMCLLATQMVLI